MNPLAEWNPLSALPRPSNALNVPALDDSSDSDAGSDTDSDTDDDTNLVLKKIWIRLLSKALKPPESAPVEEETPAEKRKRNGWQQGGWKKRCKLPYTTSMFYTDYHNVNVQDPTHRDGKEFRLNYRMPYSEAKKLVDLFIVRRWLPHNNKNVTGRSYCPAEIKILGTLYWLGEGCSFRTIYNVSGRVYSAVSFQSFAKKFCHLVAKHLGPRYIKMPKNVRELQEISKSYSELGFPGAVGSTDGVQIAWEGCPYAHRTSFTGKEGYPTLGFNVTVDHNSRIINICSVFAGRFNDKTKIRYDSYVQRLRSGFYAGFSYDVLDEHGVRTSCDTPYVICDNGYHRWKQMMAPYKVTSKPFLALWSKHLESVRKDVEKTFGCMKKRFRILKVPILFRDVSFVNDIFVTCAVIHNKLLDFDAHMQRRFAMFSMGVSSRLPTHMRRIVLVNNVRRLLQATDDYSYVDIDSDIEIQLDEEFEPQRQQLARHIWYLYVNRLLKYTVRKYK